jgi:hypothetical protein
MFRPSLGRALSTATGVFISSLALAGTALAQGIPVQDDPVARAAPTDIATRDYMFGRPRGSFAVRGNWLLASAGSDIYDFFTEQLTLEKTSFNGPTLNFEFDLALTPRLDVVGGLETSYASQSSEYRDYVDNNRLPIEQKTTLKQLGIVVSGKYALMSRGRSVSRFAWVPRTVTPYVGVGGGFLRYELVQEGDFVDFATLNVFADRFQSMGWAPSVHVLGGADVRVHRSMYVTAEGRYQWSSADLESDFVDFEPVDLSGFRFGAGIRFVF